MNNLITVPQIGFRTCDAKGFQITFENGWTVSVQFGYGNYCDNRDQRPVGGNGYRADAPKSRDAEIAAWDANGVWHKFTDDEVEGYQKPGEVLEFMNMIASKT